MENQPQNPDFRNNPENFYPCIQELTVLVKNTRGPWIAHLNPGT